MIDDGLDPAAADLRREDRAEPVPSELYRLIGVVDAPPVQQVLDVPQ